MSRVPFPHADHERAEMERRLAGGLCLSCGEPFTAANVHSLAGWAETRISGTCEDCFDALFADEKEAADLAEAFDEIFAGVVQPATVGTPGEGSGLADAQVPPSTGPRRS